jgi:hypothetical protein
MTFNVWLVNNITAFEGYYICDDETVAAPSYNATQAYKSIYMFTDTNTYYLSIGGMMATTTTGTDYFNGIIQ